jgi:SAM-dependent methyltransferase
MYVWDEVYAAGEQLNRWPFDSVVQFVFRHRPNKPRDQTFILEIGYGAGNNLWFAATEGFRAAGVEKSEIAARYARARFAEAGTVGDLRVGPFVPLPFPDRTFDLAIDRAAVSYVPFEEALGAIAEVRRVLRPTGRFLFTPYRTDQTYRREVAAPVEYWDERMLEQAFADGWRQVDRRRVTVESEAGTVATWETVWEAA